MTAQAGRLSTRRKHLIIFHGLPWLGYGLLYFFGLYYVHGRFADPVATVLVCATGAITTLLLEYVYTLCRERSLLLRVAVMLLASAAAAFVWSGVRNIAYAMLKGLPVSAWSIADYFDGATYAIYIMLAWSGFYSMYEYHQLAIRNQVQAIRAESSAREAQLKMLSFQLNPHFLFNVLNSIGVLILKKRNDQAHDMLLGLASLLRQTLYSEPWKKQPLSGELEWTGNYLDIQRIRFGDRLKVDHAIDEAAKDVMVPGMLLQPLIENAIKHGIDTSEDTATISLSARIAGDRLELEIANTFDSSENNQEAEEAGLGLANARERLEAYYGKDFQLDAHHDQQVFCVRLSIPAEFPGKNSDEGAD